MIEAGVECEDPLDLADILRKASDAPNVYQYLIGPVALAEIRRVSIGSGTLDREAEASDRVRLYGVPFRESTSVPTDSVVAIDRDGNPLYVLTGVGAAAPTNPP